MLKGDKISSSRDREPKGLEMAQLDQNRKQFKNACRETTQCEQDSERT